MKLRVAVIFGGRSGEHEVSIVSARSILSALDRKRFVPVPVYVDRKGKWKGSLKNIDVAFPIMHGTGGEDGVLQGHLETLGIPYVGCDVTASAICMDKDLTKRLLAAAGIPVARGLVLRKNTRISISSVRKELGFPVFVKPARMGSSVGVSKVKGPSQLKAAVREAFRYDDKILIEKAVPDARELECAIRGNGPYRVSRFGEIVPGAEFYTFNDKYVDGASKSILPAKLSHRHEREMREAALAACRVLGIQGMARIDFLLSRSTGEWVLNEPNTLPGFTSISMYPKLWIHEGLSYPKLLTELVRLALERQKGRGGLTRDFRSGSDWYAS